MTASTSFFREFVSDRICTNDDSVPDGSFTFSRSARRLWRSTWSNSCHRRTSSRICVSPPGPFTSETSCRTGANVSFRPGTAASTAKASRTARSLSSRRNATRCTFLTLGSRGCFRRRREINWQVVKCIASRTGSSRTWRRGKVVRRKDAGPSLWSMYSDGADTALEGAGAQSNSASPRSIDFVALVEHAEKRASSASCRARSKVAALARFSTRPSVDAEPEEHRSAPIRSTSPLCADSTTALTESWSACSIAHSCPASRASRRGRINSSATTFRRKLSRANVTSPVASGADGPTKFA
mmetsp:Transcript_40598/g.96146  ORF Transcript_40598/g.96146 Transcript_40598/m.96146 type:complete len:298 (-) Transcript_40598:342-1235(-)